MWSSNLIDLLDFQGVRDSFFSFICQLLFCMPTHVLSYSSSLSVKWIFLQLSNRLIPITCLIQKANYCFWQWPFPDVYRSEQRFDTYKANLQLHSFMFSFINCSSGGEVSIQQLDSLRARIVECFNDDATGYSAQALLDFLVEVESLYGK